MKKCCGTGCSKSFAAAQGILCSLCGADPLCETHEFAHPCWQPSAADISAIKAELKEELVKEIKQEMQSSVEPVPKLTSMEAVLQARKFLDEFQADADFC